MLQNLAGQVGSGQAVFQTPRGGSGRGGSGDFQTSRVESDHPDPIRPVPSRLDPTRPVKGPGFNQPLQAPIIPSTFSFRNHSMQQRESQSHPLAPPYLDVILHNHCSRPPLSYVDVIPLYFQVVFTAGVDVATLTVTLRSISCRSLFVYLLICFFVCCCYFVLSMVALTFQLNPKEFCALRDLLDQKP